jgi:hypothetical protein
MIQVEVFDPPMCCSSGVCGTDVDPRLAAFAADVDWLSSQGVIVIRHNLAQNPQPFVTNTLVLDLMQHDGDKGLPVVMLNGAVLGQAGEYPSREVLAQATGLVAGASHSKPKIRLSVDGGCKPGSDCC